MNSTAGTIAVISHTSELSNVPKNNYFQCGKHNVDTGLFNNKSIEQKLNELWCNNKQIAALLLLNNDMN